MTIQNCAMTVNGERCNKPVAVEHQERGPWMCAECIAESQRQAAHVSPSHTPMVADVWQEIKKGTPQDEAVRKLGGQP